MDHSHAHVHDSFTHAPVPLLERGPSRARALPLIFAMHVSSPPPSTPRHVARAIHSSTRIQTDVAPTSVCISSVLCFPLSLSKPVVDHIRTDVVGSTRPMPHRPLIRARKVHNSPCHTTCTRRTDKADRQLGVWILGPTRGDVRTSWTNEPMHAR